MNVLKSYLSVFVFIVSLAGCAGQHAQPDTPTEALAHGYVEIAALADTVKYGYESGAISSKSAAGYKSDLQKAKNLLDSAATAFNLGNMGQYSNYMVQSEQLLILLSTALEGVR